MISTHTHTHRAGSHIRFTINLLDLFKQFTVLKAQSEYEPLTYGAECFLK